MKTRGLLLLSCLLGCDALIQAEGNIKNHTVAPVVLMGNDCSACCWYGRCEGAYKGQPGTCCTPGADWGAEKCCPIFTGDDVFKCHKVNVNDYQCVNAAINCSSYGHDCPDGKFNPGKFNPGDSKVCSADGCDESACCEDNKYQLGEKNTNHCPSGYHRLTGSQCDDAASSDEMKSKNLDLYSHASFHTDSRTPGGCFLFGQHSVYFNSAPGIGHLYPDKTFPVVLICGSAFPDSVSLAEAAETNMDSNAPVFIIMVAFLLSAVVCWGLRRRGRSASVSTALLLG